MLIVGRMKTRHVGGETGLGRLEIALSGLEITQAIGDY